MVRTYMSLDPGGTTGYTLAVHEDMNLYLVPGQGRFTHRQIYDALMKYNPDYIVCEDFEYRQKSRDGLILTSVEYIGVARLWHQIIWQEGKDVRLFLQKAMEGKSYYTDKKLKELGIYQKAVPHGMDALRHLMHWFVMKRGYEFNNEPELHLVKEDWLLKTYKDSKLVWR